MRWAKCRKMCCGNALKHEADAVVVEDCDGHCVALAGDADSFIGVRVDIGEVK
jgi:hypothetical protein